MTYNQDDERLDVTVPQAMLLNTPEGYISPELWDDGEPTLMASYALSGSSTRNRELGETSNYLFGNLQTAMTLGAWRFVTYDTLNLGNDIDDEGVDHLQAFASRGLQHCSLKWCWAISTPAGRCLIQRPFAAQGLPPTIACCRTPCATTRLLYGVLPTATPQSPSSSPAAPSTKSGAAG